MVLFILRGLLEINLKGYGKVTQTMKQAIDLQAYYFLV